jgi:hypothetical protein
MLSVPIAYGLSAAVSWCCVVASLNADHGKDGGNHQQANGIVNAVDHGWNPVDTPKIPPIAAVVNPSKA